MRKNTQAVRRPRGRPQLRPDGETRRLLIQAAGEEFRAYGYAGSVIGAVARRAGVSTKTLYRLIPTKADLFRCVVSERIGHFMLAVEPDALDAATFPVALERFLIAYGELMFAEQTIGIHRLVLGESRSFPELAAAFYEEAIQGTAEAMATWLSRQCRRGLIQLEDVPTAAGMLRGMMAMEPQRAAMLGQRYARRPEEIAARARYCARLFLDGCGRNNRQYSDAQ
jgi:AcrR family transcriptional regulator